MKVVDMVMVRIAMLLMVGNGNGDTLMRWLSKDKMVAVVVGSDEQAD